MPPNLKPPCLNTLFIFVPPMPLPNRSVFHVICSLHVGFPTSLQLLQQCLTATGRRYKLKRTFSVFAVNERNCIDRHLICSLHKNSLKTLPEYNSRGHHSSLLVPQHEQPQDTLGGPAIGSEVRDCHLMSSATASVHLLGGAALPIHRRPGNLTAGDMSSKQPHLRHG